LIQFTGRTDYISLGVVAQSFPLATVKSVLAETGKSSLRQRDLPAHAVVYYVIATSPLVSFNEIPVTQLIEK